MCKRRTRQNVRSCVLRPVSCVLCHVRRILGLSAVCCLLSAVVQVRPIDAEELRDPFTFGPRESVVTPQVGPVVMGILWDATKPLAMVGDEPVGIGDLVGGWQVAEIRQNGIVVQRGARREFVSIGDGLPTD